MFSEDYVIRLFQQFVLFLVKLFKLKENNDPQLILFEIERGYQTFLGYSSAFLHKLSTESIIQIFRASSDFHYEKCMILCFLLLEEFEVYKEFEPVKAQFIWEKSKKLFDYAKDNVKDQTIFDQFKKYEEYYN